MRNLNDIGLFERLALIDDVTRLLIKEAGFTIVTTNDISASKNPGILFYYDCATLAVDMIIEKLKIAN